MAQNKTEKQDTESLPMQTPREHGQSPMEDAEYRLTVLRHSMGACIVSMAVTFQLGAMALDLGRDTLGYALAGMTAMAIFAFVAGWRSYDLSSGSRPDMGTLFLAYQEGREIITRAVTRILGIIAIADAMSSGLALFAAIILLATVAILESDRFIVIASFCGYQNQTRDDSERPGQDAS